MILGAALAASVVRQRFSAALFLGVVGYGLIKAEALLARMAVGILDETAPEDDGVYGSAPGARLELIVLGDSSAAGLGADNGQQTIGAILATGLSAFSGRRVRLTNVAVVGAGPIGLAAIMTARLLSPSHIVAIDLAASRLEAAKQFGADVIVNNATDAAEQIVVMGDLVDPPWRDAPPAQDVLEERAHVRRPLGPAKRHDEHGIKGGHEGRL